MDENVLWKYMLYCLNNKTVVQITFPNSPQNFGGSKSVMKLQRILILGSTTEFKHVDTLKLNDNIVCILLVNAIMHLFLIKKTTT